MGLIDAGVDQADGHAGTRRRILALEQVDVGVGAIGTDGLEAPLCHELDMIRVVLGQLLRPCIEILGRYAGAVVQPDAFGVRGKRRVLRRLRQRDFGHGADLLRTLRFAAAGE